jgi:hypothetical protein
VRNTLALLALASLIPTTPGCETGGASVMSQLTGNRRADFYLPEAAAAAADTEQTVDWRAIIVGVRPNHQMAGYLETREFMPAGSREPIRTYYIWPANLSEAWGFITESGRAYRFDVAGSSDTHFLGHMTQASAALYVLALCPSCGHRVDREVFANKARADLGERYTKTIREEMALEHRRWRDIDPVIGMPNLPPERGGTKYPHDCIHGTDYDVAVQFEELTQADLAPRPAVADAAPADEDDGDDSDDG